MTQKPFPIISLLLSLTLIILTSATSHTQTEPSQIVQLFRHGARGPLSGYDKTWHHHEYGALTAAGTRQHYVLGKALAKKYPKFFGGDYHASQIYVLSDTSVRCVQSAQAQLDGIFDQRGLSFREDFAQEMAVPPFVDPVVQETVASLNFSSALPYTRLPTVVNIVDGTNAAIFQRNQGSACPSNHNWEKENAHDEKMFEAWNKIFKPTLDNINSYLLPRHRPRNSIDFAIFGDALLVNMFDNRTLIDGMKNDPDLLANFTSAFSWIVLHLDYGQLIQRQLAAYHSVDAMLNQLIAFKRGSGYHQVAMFSGHDYNIYAILAAFGIVTEECLVENFYSYAANKTTPHPTCVFPGYAANIILEFYNHTDQVKFLYNNMVVPICNGKEACDYEEFLSFARNATGNNTEASFREKCHVDVFMSGPIMSQEELLRQSQQAESEHLINVKGPIFETEAPEPIQQRVIMSMATPNDFWLWVGLFGMGLLCLILTVNLVSSKRAYAVLTEEAKDQRKVTSLGKFEEIVPPLSSPGSFSNVELCVKS